MSEEYSVGYEEGYQAGWNEAVEQPVLTKDLTDEDKLALWKKWNMTAAQIDAVIAAYKEKNK